MSMNEKMNQSFVPILLYSIFFMLVLILLLIRYEPFANDDVFIYFNYARNMADGRFFAYDVRNIPSEGFTSLLYLLLLTPFEFFNINMMFAAFVINSSAIILTCYVIYRLLKVSRIVSPEGVLFIMATLIFVFIEDTSIIRNLNWGLETFLSPLITLLATLAIAYASPPYLNKQAVNIFFVLLFLAYLIRPESVAFLGLFGVLVLYTIKPHRKQLFIALIIFGIVFIGYHGLKYLIFGDIFPTGFYRKVRGDTGEGLYYIFKWFSDKRLLVGLFFISMIALTPRTLLKNRFAIFLLCVMFATIIFFLYTNPIVGDGHRFLINPTFITYFMTMTSIILFLEQRFKNISKLYWKVVGVMIGVLLFLIFSGFNGLNIYEKAEKSVSEHRYIQFGEALLDSLSHPEDITLVFGDAGAIPYVLRGTFIDTNGLTEPAIAHLFQLPDSDEKTARYITHILQYDPDIVVLTVSPSEEHEPIQTAVNIHSPFDVPTPIELYKAYSEHEIVYTCSLQLYHVLHIGLWKDSPYYDELQETLTTMCLEKGYILEDGLTITDGEQSIFFPNQKD